MTFEKDEHFKPEIDVEVHDNTVHIKSERVRDAIKCVYSYDDGIPVEDVEEVISRLSEKLMEIEDTAHHDYYGDLQDARALLMDREIPRRVDGFEHIVEEYEPRVRDNKYLTMHGLRCSIIEGIASTDNPTEAEVRAEATDYFDVMSQFINEKL